MKKLIFISFLYIFTITTNIYAQSGITKFTNKKGEVGFKSAAGKKIIDKCQGATEFVDGNAILLKNELYGVLSEDGKIIIPMKYTFISYNPTHKYFKVAIGGKVSTKKNKQELSFEDRIKDAKWGLLGVDGKELTPVKFTSIDDFNSFDIARVVYDKKIGYINTSGKTVIDFIYKDAGEEFSENGRNWFAIDDLYGIIDATGKEIIPVKNSILMTYEDYVEINGTYSDFLRKYTNKTSLKKSKYPYYYYFTGTKAGDKVKLGIISKDGDVFIEDNKYEVTDMPSDGYLLTKSMDKNFTVFSVFDFNTKKLSKLCEIPATKNNRIECTIGFHNIIRIKDASGVQYFDFKGKAFGKYVSGANFNGDFVFVGGVNKKYGILNFKGELVLKCIYDNIRYQTDQFSETSIFLVEKDKLYGFIDINGRNVSLLNYEWATTFRNGTALVKKNGFYGAIDKNNNSVIPIKWSSMSKHNNPDNKNVWVYDKYVWRLYDIEHNKTIDNFSSPSYDSKTLLTDGTTVVSKKISNGYKFGVVNNRGEIILDYILDSQEMADKINRYRFSKKLPKLNSADVFIYAIVEKGKSLTYSVNSQIPQTDWDY